MKHKILLLLLVIVSNVITYAVTTGNNQKDFEAACFYSDIIRHMMDNDSIGSEVKESYDEWTQDMDELEFTSIKYKDLNNYSWCY